MVTSAWMWLGVTALLTSMGQEMDIRRILKERDASVDNVTVRYVRRGVVGLACPAPALTINPNQKPMLCHLFFESHERLTLRWPCATFESVRHERVNDQTAIILTSPRWTNVTPRKVEAGTESDETNDCDYSRLAEPTSENGEQVILIEGALGIGVGRRLKTLRAVRQSDKGIWLEGTLELGDGRVAQIVAEMDGHLILRNLKMNQPEWEYCYEISTKGTLESRGRLLAESGHVKRVWRPASDVAIGTKRATVMDEFDVLFTEIRFDLSDDEYIRLATVKVPSQIRLGESLADAGDGDGYNGLAYRSSIRCLLRWCALVQTVVGLLLLWQTCRRAGCTVPRTRDRT
jgi:hypothetical protein